jgi:very-short-patch-repair endonuclease
MTEGEVMTASRLVQHARRLRKTMTPEEVKLWVQLKHLNARGFHFRRQAPLDGYIVDFAEFRHRLIIEVDGSQHGTPEGVDADAIRDRHFERSGFRVLRFWNIDINMQLDGTVRKIEEALRDSPLPRPAGGPSPQRGRER